MDKYKIEFENGSHWTHEFETWRKAKKYAAEIGEFTQQKIWVTNLNTGLTFEKYPYIGRDKQKKWSPWYVVASRRN